MELMVVKDVMLGKNDQTILTGPLLLKEFSLRSEVEEAFGSKVFVSNELGNRICVPVNGVSVSQGMAGNWQVSIAIDFSAQEGKVVLDSVVSDAEWVNLSDLELIGWVPNNLDDAARTATSGFTKLSSDSRKYLNDLELQTGFKVTPDQRTNLANALREQEFSKLSKDAAKTRRNEFNRVKDDLISQWEQGINGVRLLWFKKSKLIVLP